MNITIENGVYSHNGMTVEVILASKPTNGAAPIITIHARYPRIIHSELMTHRVFSRNARSSRAVPVKTMLEEVWRTPFVPWHWGKNQSGMQAGEECNTRPEVNWFHEIDPNDDAKGYELGKIEQSREDTWIHARDAAHEVAEAYMKAGYHKQIANRLLEPFMFIDTLITSTSWANFLHLRDHKDAEPHIRDLAVLIKEAIAGANYESLEPGQWHLPYVPHWERADIVKAVTGKTWDQKWDEADRLALAKISVARCARISYKPFDGDGSIERELERYERLVGSTPLHASPAEHQATPMRHRVPGSFNGNLGEGWIQFRKKLDGEYVADAA
ncbi:hypothetical protein FHV99_004584 [Ochrobactrum sp. P20RRXII]|nr:FAD-dependent thymidylate synthase [Ochrobactrum sp. P20RRXII]NIH77332.1 hypothetical protein [Ochrobactrum sp. P20RRXII]